MKLLKQNWIWNDDGLLNRRRRVSVPQQQILQWAGNERAAYVKLEVVGTQGWLFSYLLFFIKAFPNQRAELVFVFKQKLMMKNKGNYSVAVGSRVGNKIPGVKCKANESILSPCLFVSLLCFFPSTLPSFLLIFSKGPLWIRAKLLFNPSVSFCPLDNSLRSIKDSHHRGLVVQNWECSPATLLIQMLYELEPRPLTSTVVISKKICNYILQPACQECLKTITAFQNVDFFKVTQYISAKWYDHVILIATGTELRHLRWDKSHIIQLLNRLKMNRMIGLEVWECLVLDL